MLRPVEALHASDSDASARQASAWALKPRGTRELPSMDRQVYCELLQGDVGADRYELLLASLARLRGAVDLGLGDGLAALTIGQRLVSLGYSSLGDYAREVLGVGERTAPFDFAAASRLLRSG